MPPFLDPASLNDMAGVTPAAALSTPPSPILILSPSSLSHRPHILESLLASIPQPHDLHMLDRIALNFAYLPPSHYSEAILARPKTDEKVGEVDADYTELTAVFGKLLGTMQPRGRIKIGSAGERVIKDAILAGFLVETENHETILVKPRSTEPVPLRLKRPRSSDKSKTQFAFLSLDSSDTIDDSTLLGPQDFTKPVVQPIECAPPPGKRRKACKDCACGLKELEEAENETARKLPIVMLGDDELDFTMQGKSSCGSCGLGDAFRCAGCPFIGMPAFKPGEEVKLFREAARWADDI